MPTALITSGPTREKIDPVRFISNYSSGKQGYAIAESLRDKGFDVVLISGPVNLPAPSGVKIVNVESAQEMLDACEKALPVDVAVCAAAVCDFKSAEVSGQKIKKARHCEESNATLAKQEGSVSTTKQSTFSIFLRWIASLCSCFLPAAQVSHSTPRNDAPRTNSVLNLKLLPTPDILATLATHAQRPKIVAGFAAETENLIPNATAKLNGKNCDIIVANNVSGGAVFGSDTNSITILTDSSTESHNNISKTKVAELLVDKIVGLLAKR